MSKVRYRAGTQVSVVVFLHGTRSKRLRFIPITGGGSYYDTSDEEEQKALEAHPMFGQIFRKDELWLKTQAVAAAKVLRQSEEKKKKDATKAKKAAPSGGGDGSVAAVVLKEVSMPDMGAAKNYLSAKYGVPRTNVKTKADVLAAAQKNGVLFTGKWTT